MEEDYYEIGELDGFKVFIKVPKLDKRFNHPIDYTKSVEVWKSDFEDAFKILEGIRAFKRNY